MLGGQVLPSTEDIQRKLKDLQLAHQFKFKDDDIIKVSTNYHVLSVFKLFLKTSWHNLSQSIAVCQLV